MRITWKLFGGRSSKRAPLLERESLIAFAHMNGPDQAVMARALIDARNEAKPLRRAS